MLLSHYNPDLKYRKLKQLFDESTIRTGWYQFYYEGGMVTGNVFRIGNNSVWVDVPIMGKGIEIGLLVFVDSITSKL